MSPSKNSRTSSTLPPASTLSSCFSSFSITSLIHFLWFHELRHIWTFWLCLQNTLILQWLWFPQCWDNLVPSSSTIARVMDGGKVGWIGNKSLSVSWKHKLASSFKLTIFSKKKPICLPDPQQPGGTMLGHQLQGSWQDQDHKKRAAVNLHWWSLNERWDGNEPERKEERGE